MLHRNVVVVLVGLTVFNIGCSNLSDKISGVVFPAHWKSWKVKGEEFNVELVYERDTLDSPASIAPDNVMSAQSGGAGVLAGGLAVDAAASFLKSEAERYTASYSGYAVGDKFYGGWDLSAKVNLQNITLKRTVHGESAMDMTIAVKPTLDKTAFQLIPSSLTVKLAKAKVHAFNWLEPWTWFGCGDGDRNLDLVVRLAIHAAWIDRSGNSHFDKLAEGEFAVRKIEFDKPKQPSNTFAGQLIPAVPRSRVGSIEQGGIVKPILGTGNFVVSVLVTEFDEYGERIREQAGKLEEKKEDIVSKIGEYIK